MRIVKSLKSLSSVKVMTIKNTRSCVFVLTGWLIDWLNDFINS
jgi:hypothetical protein